MNENINLCEILKYCPEGGQLYSTLYGVVEFSRIDYSSPLSVRVIDKNNTERGFDKKGKKIAELDGECLLFPSKDQRDWSKFKPKKPKFDPKTLKPFDRVIVKQIQNYTWHTQYFSHINEKCTTFPFFCLIDNYAYCIPYNDDTKHLVGTTDEAPEYYRYWED